MHNLVAKLRHVKLLIFKRLVAKWCFRHECFVVDFRSENNGELLQQFVSFYCIIKTSQPRRPTVEMNASTAKSAFHDRKVWPLTLKTFSAMPTYVMNIMCPCSSIEVSPLGMEISRCSKYLLTDGRTDRRPKDIMQCTAVDLVYHLFDIYVG